MTVREFCTREIVIATRQAGVVEAAKLMRRHHVGDIVVVDAGDEGNIPVGILTDRDLVVELVAAEVSFESLAVEDIMAHDLLVVREDDGIWETLQRMKAKGVRRVPVVNDKGFLEGLLSIDDVLELLAEEMSILSKIPERGQIIEKKCRD